MMNSVLIFCIGLLLLLTGLLVSKRKLSQSQGILSIWLLLTAAEVWVFYIERNALYGMYPWLIGVKELFLLIHPPLLFIFALSVVKGPFKKIRLLHLGPFFTWFSLWLFMDFSLGKAVGLTGNPLLIPILLSLYVFAYLLCSQQLIRANRQLKKRLGIHEQLSFTWTYRVVSLYLIIWCLIMATSLSNGLLALNLPTDVLRDISMGAFALFIISMSVIGLKSTNLFVDYTLYLPEDIAGLENAKLAKRYAKSGLNETDALALCKRLDAYTTQHQPFINAKITLSEFAGALETTTNHLSQVINQYKGQSFNDFINAHRIAHFQKLIGLEAYAHYSLLGLALECGFNSKSAFNTAFKKHTGLTPSAYQQQVLVTD